MVVVRAANRHRESKSIRKSLLIKTSQKAGKSLKAGSAAAAALVVKLMSRLFFCSMQFFSVKRHGMLFYCQQQNLVKMVAIFTTYSFFMRPRPSMDISFTESKLYIHIRLYFVATICRKFQSYFDFWAFAFTPTDRFFYLKPPLKADS